jgi:hypothetical protein
MLVKQNGRSRESLFVFQLDNCFENEHEIAPKNKHESMNWKNCRAVLCKTEASFRWESIDEKQGSLIHGSGSTE